MVSLYNFKTNVSHIKFFVFPFQFCGHQEITSHFPPGFLVHPTSLNYFLSDSNSDMKLSKSSWNVIRTAIQVFLLPI